MTTPKAQLRDDPDEVGACDRDRRHAPRVLANLEVDYVNQDNFLFAYIHDISVTGIFVRTNTPEIPGTRINLRFTPSSRAKIIDVEGEVIWINPYRPSDNNCLYPGMGLRFVDLTDDQLLRITELVRTFAYLDDDSDSDSDEACDQAL
jgi:uncharacterized protein (TIGR02266 family)